MGAAPAMLFPTMFSSVASQLKGKTNRLYTLREQLRARGRPIVDLVSGNVTEHGLVFPPDILEHALAGAVRRCAVYRPDSFGQRPAREAVSAYYARQGVPISPDRFVLTPGTSISYWYSFRLLADEGDEILCPNPSYPLFDYIALLCGVRLIPYRLQEARGWAIDMDQLEACISTRTRALALISPHNPTGYVPDLAELEGLAELAARHDLAIISDEVFSEFLLGPGPLPRPALTAAPLVITLNGFSKMYALPGLKLGWMALSGEEGRVGRALAALEMISDTFLPVSEIAQAAVPDIMSRGGPFLEGYSAEIRRRWAEAARVLGRCPELSFVPRGRVLRHPQAPGKQRGPGRGAAAARGGIAGAPRPFLRHRAQPPGAFVRTGTRRDPGRLWAHREKPRPGEVRAGLFRTVVRNRRLRLSRPGGPWGVTGSRIRNVEPRSGSLSTSIDPPCSLMTLSTTARPSPIPTPSFFVVNPGSNILPRCSRGMPDPVSDIVTTT